MLLAPGHAFALPIWPKVELPADVQTFDVGGDFLSNGMPTRATGFISPRGTSAVADWFNSHPATHWSVERMQEATVLGRAEGKHFITIKLTPVRNGTKGLVSIVDMAKAAQEAPRLQARLAQWMSALPSGTRVMNHIASNDAGRLSEHLVLVNQQSEALNIHSVTAALVGRGFAVERTLDPSSTKAPSAPSAASPQQPPGKAVLFKSGTREAIAVFFRGTGGQSVITINTITQEQP
ncbi:MAG: hypothetical protein ACOZE7_18805 [Pseudomonadota bacterium]|jgi:hypothetical protein